MKKAQYIQIKRDNQLVDGGRLHKSMAAVQCWVAIKYTMLQITEYKT